MQSSKFTTYYGHVKPLSCQCCSGIDVDVVHVDRPARWGTRWVFFFFLFRNRSTSHEKFRRCYKNWKFRLSTLQPFFPFEVGLGDVPGTIWTHRYSPSKQVLLIHYAYRSVYLYGEFCFFSAISVGAIIVMTHARGHNHVTTMVYTIHCGWVTW